MARARTQCAASRRVSGPACVRRARILLANLLRRLTTAASSSSSSVSCGGLRMTLLCHQSGHTSPLSNRPKRSNRGSPPDLEWETASARYTNHFQNRRQQIRQASVPRVYSEQRRASATVHLSPFQPAYVDTGRESDCSRHQRTANRAGCAKLALSISSPNGLGTSMEGYLCLDKLGSM